MRIEDIQLILGALDTLSVNLADNNHTWSAGERCIYEQAIEILKCEALSQLESTKGESI